MPSAHPSPIRAARVDLALTRSDSVELIQKLFHTRFKPDSRCFRGSTLSGHTTVVQDFRGRLSAISSRCFFEIILILSILLFFLTALEIVSIILDAIDIVVVSLKL